MSMLLTLLRHAKAVSARGQQDDFDRELELAGRHDAERVAQRLCARGRIPDIMLTSPAARALETARVFVTVLGTPMLLEDERLYLASSETLLEVVRERGDDARHLMIVGHNPGMSEFADKLSANVALGSLPTASAYTLRFDIETWSQLDWRSGVMLEFDHPR